MLKQELLKINQKLTTISMKNIQWIIGLSIIYFIILLSFRIDLKFKWSFKKFSPIRLNKTIISSTDLLLLYKKELFRFETTSFQPIFYNYQLKLKLNLTNIAIDDFSYLKNNSIKELHQLNITCLQRSKYSIHFISICNISMNFYVKRLNTNEIHLTFLSKNSTCLLSFRNMSEIISINLQKIFSLHDQFRFTYRWSHFSQTRLISWSQWPLLFNENKMKSSLVNILLHSTSQELYNKEQHAVSNWLDLQYKSSTNSSINNRRLAPFEISKNTSICSQEFQNWILNYRQWHENQTFTLQNYNSMTLEEQRNYILKNNLRFLIYEKESGGIADKLIHLISSYFVALLTNRLFIFDKDWLEFFDVLQPSLNYEQNLIQSWYSQLEFLNKNISKNNSNYLTFKSHYFSLERYTKDYNYDKDFSERILLFKGHTGNIIHTIQSNTSIYQKFLTINLKMNSKQIFGCLYHSLFTYRLSYLIKLNEILSSINDQLGHRSEDILRILLSPNFNSIGIQIRVGDQTMTDKKNQQLNIENFQQFFSCAKDLIRKNEIILNKTNEKSIAFLLSDSYQLRQSALKQWKYSSTSNQSQLHIVSNSNPVLHVQYANNRLLALQLGMFDIFLFSLCEQHIISTRSGFGRLPAFISLKQRNIYSFYLHEKHNCQNEGISLDTSAHYWSGI